MIFEFRNNATTTLSASMTDSDSSFTVTDASLFPSGAIDFIVKIDDELIHISSTSGTTFTVGGRAFESTTAVSHSSGATVIMVLTKAGLDGILNGTDNVVSAPTSQCLAGDTNVITSSEYNQTDAIVGGGNNTIDGASNSVICGGESHDMIYNTTNVAANCFIGGGSTHTVQPPAGVNINNSAIVGGYSNTVNSDRSVILGGAENNLQYNAKDCVAIGKYAELGWNDTPVRNAFVHGHDLYGITGEAQLERHFAGVLAVSSSPYQAYTNITDSSHITLPANYFATGTVKAIGVGAEGQTYHRVIHFAAANLGFGASILNQTTTEYAYDSTGSGPNVTLYGTSDTLYASCTGDDAFIVKWFLCWEFIRLYCETTGLTS